MNKNDSRQTLSILYGSFRINTLYFPSSRGMVYYSVRRDVSTNDGHRHGDRKVVGKEVRRCKFIHFNAACYDSQERANSSTFFIRARYWYVLLLVTFPFIASNVIVRLYYSLCIMQPANDCKFSRFFSANLFKFTGNYQISLVD